LAYGTVRNILPFVVRFLAQQYPRHDFDFAALKVDDVITFVRRQAAELGSVQAKHMVTALRSFFRYLRHRGEIYIDLAAQVWLFEVAFIVNWWRKTKRMGVLE